ncbi:MAG: hypothetical protein ACYDH9_26550 [Limisphaerales bacterium]
MSTQGVVTAVVMLWTLMNAGLWAWSRLRLRLDFRTVSTLRFQPKRPWAGWWPFRRAA